MSLYAGASLPLWDTVQLPILEHAKHLTAVAAHIRQETIGIKSWHQVVALQRVRQRRLKCRAGHLGKEYVLALPDGIFLDLGVRITPFWLAPVLNGLEQTVGTPSTFVNVNVLIVIGHISRNME